MPTAILLTNPRAGFGDCKFRFNGETIVLGDHDLPNVTGHDLVIVAGGDGTLQRVVSTLLASAPANSLPMIAVLPSGRTNMSAVDINQHQRFSECAATLNNLLKQTTPPTPQSRSLIKVRASQEVRYGWFFGLGALCSGIAYWNQDRPRSRVGGGLRTVWAGARECMQPSRHQLVMLDGEQRAVFTMLATTLNRLIFGCRPYWNSGHSGLHNTWVFAEAQGLLRRSFKLLRGDPALGLLPGYQSGEASKLGFEFDGPYTLDGELFHNSGPMHLSLSDPIQWMPL